MKRKEMKPPKRIWILVDVDNGDCGVDLGPKRRGRNYLWWFHTRQEARDHKSRQNAEAQLVGSTTARLEGPFRYEVSHE